MSYARGATATLITQFYSYPGGPAVDVAGLTITISPVGGGAAVVGPTSTGVVHEATGVYSYQWGIAADEDIGDYLALWEATGGVQSSEVVTVTASGIAYATLTELKNARRIPLTDTAEDTDLQSALVRASRAIDRRTGRLAPGFSADTTATAREFAVVGRIVRRSDGDLLMIDDVSSAVGFVVEQGDGTTFTILSSSAYELEPGDALVKNEPITGVLADKGTWGAAKRCRVTTLWGWPSIPDDIVDATLLLANRRFMRRDSPEGVAGWSDQGPVRVSRFDPDIEDIVSPYVKSGF